jgi:hypothetical protein
MYDIMYGDNNSSQEGEEADGHLSIDVLIARLQRDEKDLNESLQHFHKDRQMAIDQQKRAWLAYEEEIARIEAEYAMTEHGNSNFEPLKKSVDHNILKHLNIDKRSEILALDADNNLAADANNHNIDNIPRISMASERKLPKKFGELALQEQQLPPPSFDEKKKAREQLFDHFEESAVEETRLELEIEQARELENTKLVEELSEALYYLQRLHNNKLNGFVAQYRPQVFTGKNWGQDPDYQQMTKQLKIISDTFHNHLPGSGDDNKHNSSTSSNLPDISDERHKQKAKKKKHPSVSSHPK